MHDKQLRYLSQYFKISGSAKLSKPIAIGDFMEAKDSNGVILKDGDSVQLIKDLKVKGTSTTLKRGTIIKNIRLTDNTEEIECKTDKVKGLVLKTCFLKKA